MLYFKVYKSQLQVIERALETASLMLGSQQVPRLLPGDDLRRLSGRRNSGRNEFGCFFSSQFVASSISFPGPRESS